VLLSATGIANSLPPDGAIRNPSFPELPFTLRVIAMVSFSFYGRGALEVSNNREARIDYANV
jgi:hypothetical protein